MVLIIEKATGEIVQTEDFKIVSAFDGPEFRADLEERGFMAVGIPYELGTDALNHKAVLSETYDFLGIVAKNNEEGDA